MLIRPRLPDNRPKGMALDMSVLLKDIKSAYVFLKENNYPDCSLSSPSCDEFGKDNSRATEFKNKGNAAFGCRRDRKAIKCYTKSIQLATDKSKELALAYANRSAALFRLGEYVPCLLDINRALKGEYPEHLRNKLQDRKKKCLLEIVKMGVNIVGEETDPIDSMATSNKSTVPKGTFDNPLLPNTSSKIKLACDEKWGRHTVAINDIEPGEILSCEQFFATFVLPWLQWTHCSYCAVRCPALIPCPSCSQMMYCSEKCLTRASNAYHRTECRMMPFLADDEDDIDEAAHDVAEALRLLFVGTEQGSKIEPFIASMSPQDLFKENVNPVNKPYASDYRSILQLRRKFEHPSHASILVAVKAIVWLQRCSFFKNRPNPNSMSITELFATLTLLNHMQSMDKYEFSEMTISARDLPGLKSGQEMLLGHGIAPLHNLVNHSCNPNVVFIGTREREHIIFSIFVGYCPTYAKLTLTQRKKHLSSFKFTCCCEACTNDWPLYGSMITEKPKFLTNDKKIIAKIRKMIAQTAQVHVKHTNIRDLIRCRKLIHDYVRSPSLFASGCEDLIVEWMVRTYSNLCYENNDVDWMKKQVAETKEEILTLFRNISI